MIVYDITNRESFNKIAEWHQTVNDKCKKNATFILVGNKIDLEFERQVSHEEGLDKAKQLNMLFMETSAKTNVNSCVQNAFDQVVNLVSVELVKEEENESEKQRSTLMGSIVRLDAPPEAESRSCC